jgi:hypothetical protein
VLDMMACKAAVKAGDGLSEGELDELMSLRETGRAVGKLPARAPDDASACRSHRSAGAGSADPSRFP